MKSFIQVLTLVTVVLLSAASCKKTEPCEAIITVVDPQGAPVPGARVVLRQDSVVNPQTGVRADILEEEFTSSNGEAIFEFKWEAVLNVEVDVDTLSARDYIRLEQSETVRKTVTVR
ncbi:MAG: carboxypeptidase-like regulatory domain-containing protein [Sphingobacteriales bacterium]|jgi:hypothetical protein|nr:carboxypeptidase-like regulatory domain-containing protein [Sphingobacteriales bacterium]